MHDYDFILTLAGALTVALAFGYLSQLLRLSPIVGYLVAGIVVGPHTPGFDADQELAEQMAEVGVILLMFGVGMHFKLSELLAVRRIAVPGALIQGTVITLVTMMIVRSFGWSFAASLVFGMSICVASTVVLTRVLTDANQLHTSVGHIAIGWLIVQDILAVLALVLLPEFFGKETLSAWKVPTVVGIAALKMGGLTVAVLIIGGKIVPWLLKNVAATKSRELFTLTILVVALGIAVGSSMFFGVSMALGAFLAGMVVGRSDFSVRAATEALPMRDAFAVLFFVSVGMLFDPALLWKKPLLLACLVGVILFVTPTLVFLVVLVRGYPVRTAIGLALAMTEIGEFSFILGGLGKKLGILDEQAIQLLVAIAIITISLNPMIYRLEEPLARWAARKPRLWQRLNRCLQTVDEKSLQETKIENPLFLAVIIGYGPVGRTLTRLLQENKVEVSIVELNIDTVRFLKREGIRAVYGDATHPDTLKEAGIEEAGSLILSSSGMQGSAETIRIAREMNPDIRILARSGYVRELTSLRKAGAENVFSGEGEVALALTEAILLCIGATPEQIDRERERVRAELIG